MKLKIKKEYSEHSIFVKGKRTYFIELSEEKKEFWFNNGYDFVFDVEKKPIVKKEEIKIEKLDLEDDTNK